MTPHKGQPIAGFFFLGQHVACALKEPVLETGLWGSIGILQWCFYLLHQYARREPDDLMHGVGSEKEKWG